MVIKRLLQNQAADPKEIVTHMARLLDSITVAQARAAILWLLGEHSQKVPTIAPDVLRKMAKTFPDEVSIHKIYLYTLIVINVKYLIFYNAISILEQLFDGQ